VPSADRLTTRELSARLAERTTAARERRLSPAELAGGTFTVNNYGVFGVDGCDGGFLRYVADCIESPATALGDL
jgi:pyruvate dehydrogenase E2 component (dihydrolipoamide acetyltransferase)